MKSGAIIVLLGFVLQFIYSVIPIVIHKEPNVFLQYAAYIWPIIGSIIIALLSCNILWLILSLGFIIRMKRFL